MIAVQHDFTIRAGEVTRYFVFLREFDEARSDFQTSSPAPFAFSLDERVGLFKTLKANGFLLLYNLVESTLKNAIEAIFDEFKIRGVAFDSCLDGVRRIVLANVKKRNVDEMLPKLSSITVDLAIATFRKEELFSGNVDGRRIKEIADNYGFQRPKSKSDQLLTVKTNRNDLAHGDKSFSEVGRDYDVNELEKIQIEVVTFLQELLGNVSEYIAKQAYLSIS